MFKNILLPTDGSELSEKAILKGIEFAQSVGAKITAFHVAQEYSPILATEGFGYLDPATIDIFEQNVKTYAEKCLSFIEEKAKGAGVDCQSSYEKSYQIYDAIIQAAQKNGCDLIWMASHGRKGLSALLLGSETTKVLTHSGIPVLVYR